MNAYLLNINDKVYSPESCVDSAQNETDQKNKETEAKEIEWLKTAPERVFLYINRPEPKDGFTQMWEVATWLGTRLAYASMGDRTSGGLFGYGSYKRAMSCRLFGALYHGWYFESSGSYCRLRKAKRQYN